MQKITARVRHYGPGGRENGGGIGRLIGYIAEAAARSGEPHLVTDTRGPRWELPASAIKLLSAVSAMIRDRISAPQRIHHIHLAGRGSTARKLILTAVARGLGCTHVLHLHDYDYAADLARRSSRMQALIGRMFRGTDRVIVLGQRDRTTVIRDLGVSPERVSVLANAVADPGPRLPTRKAVPMILFLGQLGPRKGVPELVEALASPVMAKLDWQAVLAGDGAVEETRAQIAALGLSRRVALPGWLGSSEVAARCRQAEILVLPSHAEGLAMAVLEGLAHGLAVVTTRVGAHEEAITHGETGIFVPVGDAAALAQALADLLTDDAARIRLAEQGRALFLARFSIDAYMRRLGVIYHELEPAAGGLVRAA